MARKSKFLDFNIEPLDLKRVRRKLEQSSGKPLKVRMQRSTKQAADLMVPRIKPQAPKQKGILRKSVKARSGKANFRGRMTVDAFVGPVAPHRHLIIQGHRIGTPGGRDTGRRTTPNPFVDRAKSGFERKAVELVAKEWGEALR